MLFYSSSFVVMGGTEIIGDWDTTVSQTDKNRIWDLCTKYVPSLTVSISFSLPPPPSAISVSPSWNDPSGGAGPQSFTFVPLSGEVDPFSDTHAWLPRFTTFVSAFAICRGDHWWVSDDDVFTLPTKILYSVHCSLWLHFPETLWRPGVGTWYFTNMSWIGYVIFVPFKNCTKLSQN